MVSCKTVVFVFASLLAAQAAPVRREVPQEHSHEATLRAVRALLQLNNPDGIVDVVFGLLGNAAASNGLGQISDPDCLQQATADQAFTNAKAANDVQGQVDALIFRALERNTGKVGLASVACTAIQAVNPEIAAISQHQDPASANAATINKEITLELARQIASVGGDPLDALKSGTFAPGDVNDPTAAGNTCNDENDAEGCIFSQNLIVDDASAAEIQAAVNGAGNANNNAGNANNNAGNANNNAGNANNNAGNANNNAGNANNNAGNANNAGAGNLQKFTGALGGKPAPAVTAGGRGFVVEGSDSFLNLNAALGRSCDIFKNSCANVANSAAGRAQGLSVAQCDQEQAKCRAANGL